MEKDLYVDIISTLCYYIYTIIYFYGKKVGFLSLERV